MADTAYSEYLLMLADSHAVEGRRLLALSTECRAEALQHLPVGAVLHMPGFPGAESYRFRLTKDGWTSWFGEDPVTPSGDEWVTEQWACGNLRILDGPETKETPAP